MKCLSLWEPWASLIAVRSKEIETRSWATSYRGPLLICAALNWTNELARIAESEPFRTPLTLAGWRFGTSRPRTLGQALAVVDLFDCMEIARPGQAAMAGVVMVPPPEPERSFGNYGPGRFGWLLRNIRRLPVPIPLKGGQRLYDRDIDHLIEQQLGRVG